MRKFILASCMAGLVFYTPAHAQDWDWSGPYFGIHAGGTDGVKASAWADARVEETRIIEEIPPELITPGFCETAGGTPLPGLADEASCASPPHEWQEISGTCFDSENNPVEQYANEDACNGATTEDQQLNEWIPGTPGYCWNEASKSIIPGLDTEEKCDRNPNGTWFDGTADVCMGPGGELSFDSESECLAAGFQPGQQYSWVDGSLQCINTLTQQLVPGVTSEQQCEGSQVWHDPVYSDLIPGFDSTLSAMQSAMRAASRSTSMLAGAQAGYNWQRGNFVFGIEGDFSGISNRTDPVRAKAFASLAGEEMFGTWLKTEVKGTASLDWLATLRGRAGMVVRRNFLPFVTGGVAFGKVGIDGKARFSGAYGLGGTTEPFSHTVSLNDSGILTGYTVGAGLDYRLSSKVFLNFTYLYVDLGKLSSSASYSGSRSDPAGNSSIVTGAGGIDVDARFNVLKFGINMQF